MVSPLIFHYENLDTQILFMGKFVKLTIKKSNPVGGGSHPCNMLVNTDNILYIEQFSDVYRIKLVGREEIIIEEEDYKQLIKELN